ncbi:MAG: glycosyltransferase family 39 protein [Myxococcota bacterium]|nr:glycosyltransferase family 39 protein [Myxococcota bacterium]
MLSAQKAPEETGSTWSHVLLLVSVSLVFEWAFVGTNLNLLDEGWPLYAAMQLHAGGTLYEDVFFVFPPGHLLMAWIAYGIDPPGVFLARVFYAFFDIALVVALYFLGRRVMPARFAVFGALLLALAAESAHQKQLLFGYRYLVISVLALIAFARYLEQRDRLWLVVAGALTGLALAFRLTPAFATACGVGIALVAVHRNPRQGLRDGFVYGFGIIILALPVLLWMLSQAPPETLWREVLIRPVAMTDRQSLAMPPWIWMPEQWTRRYLHEWFVMFQFRAWTLLYIGYGVGLAWIWARSKKKGTVFTQPLLLAIVIWGGVYFGRSFGRSDAPHLYSALPPVCLLLAHLSWRVLGPQKEGTFRVPRSTRWSLGAVGLALWILLMGSDRIFWPGHLGREPMASLRGRIGVNADTGLLRVDEQIRQIQQWTQPGEIILDLSASSLFYVLSDRVGPGHADIIMPGTFLDPAEERDFLKLLDANPPALVIFPGWIFDERKDRAVQRSSPLLWQWVKARYDLAGPYERFVLMLPKERMERMRARAKSSPEP